MAGKSKIIGAIDVGTTKVVAIIARKNENGSIDILGYGKEKSIGVKKGTVLNLPETVKSISSAIAKAQQQAGVTVKEVYVGMAGHHIRSKVHHGYIIRENEEEPITKEEVNRLIKSIENLTYDVGFEVIHVIPKSYTVDKISGLADPIGYIGKKLEASFHIVIGELSPIRILRRCIEDSGLKVKKIFLEPLASAAAVLTPEEIEMGVAMIDIGGGTTDLAVYHQECVQHTAVIPFGGNAVTEDLRKTLFLLEREAERIKIECGHAIAADQSLELRVAVVEGHSGRPSREINFSIIAKTIEYRMTEIIELVIQELKHAQITNKLAAGIVITGGGALLKNLPQLIAYHTGKDVRVAYPRVPFTSENFKELNNPIYSTILGLVILGFEDLEEELANNPEITTVEANEKMEHDPQKENNNTPSGKNELKKIFGFPKKNGISQWLNNLTEKFFSLSEYNMDDPESR